MRQVRFPTAGKEEEDGEMFVNLTWVSVSHIDELQELKAGAFSGKLGVTKVNGTCLVGKSQRLMARA
jgi:hypothetical protein